VALFPIISEKYFKKGEGKENGLFLSMIVRRVRENLFRAIGDGLLISRGGKTRERKSLPTSRRAKRGTKSLKGGRPTKGEKKNKHPIEVPGARGFQMKRGRKSKGKEKETRRRTGRWAKSLKNGR